MNIGKKGLIFIVVCFILLAVILSIPLTRDALFNGLGIFGVTVQSAAVGVYTAVTTNPFYLQWHVLIQGIIWSTLAATLTALYFKGKLKKLTGLVGKSTPTNPSFVAQTSPAIPESAPKAQETVKPEEKEVIVK